MVDQLIRAGRRPLAQLVIIYASNQKVMEYSQKVLEQLLKSGIDVYVQMTAQVGPTAKSRGAAPLRVHCCNLTIDRSSDIESHHLADIITSSKADYLVVTGDRNWKNETLQVKRRGRLVEMRPDALISLVWTSWPQTMQESIKGLSKVQISDLAFRLSGLRHLWKRLDFIRPVSTLTSLNPFHSWQWPRR